MGRYYSGDIDGKFWFGIQSSTAPARFGCHEEQDVIHYYIDEDSIDEIEDELNSIRNKLGDNLKKFQDFFEQNNSYNSQMLKDNGLDENLLGEYADYLLGMKIYNCVNESGTCSFSAEL